MPNTNVIIIRFHPVEPVAASDFTAALVGLTITAYDISFANATTDLESLKVPANRIGQPAQFLSPDAYDASPNLNNRIFQHFRPPLGPQPMMLYSVASAVIEVPAGLTEFASPDVLLKIERNGKPLIEHSFHYNVAITTITDSLNPANPPALRALGEAVRAAPASLYVALPPAGQGAKPSPSVTLPEGGTPPKYDELLAAVTDVINKDPGVGNANLAQLTPEQCRHIAYEIVWNRTSKPLPGAPSSNNAQPPSLEYLYTGVPASDLTGTLKEAERKKFEGEVESYYATRNAEAERLSQYVYSLSAALYCANKSEAVSQVTFRFPVRPLLPDNQGKITEAVVVLK